MKLLKCDLVLWPKLTSAQNVYCLSLKMKGINTYKLCESNYLVHQYVACYEKKVRARTTCQQDMKN
jgi:hypothetical protein